MSRSQICKDHPEKKHLIEKDVGENARVSPIRKERRHFYEAYQENN